MRLSLSTSGGAFSRSLNSVDFLITFCFHCSTYNQTCFFPNTDTDTDTDTFQAFKFRCSNCPWFPLFDVDFDNGYTVFRVNGLHRLRVTFRDTSPPES